MKEQMKVFFARDPFAKWFVGFFFVLVAGFLAHYWVVGQATYGDGIYHYAFTHSIVKDGDLSLDNQYGHKYSPDNNNSLTPEKPAYVVNITDIGFAENKYGIGAPLFWIIPFGFVELVVVVWNIISVPIPTSGFSDFYQIVVGLFNVAAATTGAVLLYIFLKEFFKPMAAFLAVSLLLFGSNLFYYSSLDVINSHPFSFLISTIFLFYWWKTFLTRTLKQWLILGFLLGILLTIRTQDVVFLVLPLAEACVFLRKNGLDFQLAKKQLVNYFVFGIALVIAFAPQLVVWQTIYGDIWTSPYIRGGEGFNFLKPHLVELFVQTKIGILWWTPLFIVCIGGLLAYLRKSRMLAGLSLLLVVSEIYFIASWSGWTQGEAYGVRMLISSIPFMAIGLAYVLQELLQRFTAKKVYAMCLVIVLVNMALIFYFLLMHQSNTNDGTVVTQERSLEKIQQFFKLPL